MAEVSDKTGENVLVSYTYDDNGNLLSQLDVDNTAVVTHSYDGFNRLISSVTGDGTITYTYNAQGIRTSRTVGITTTNYLLDGGNVIGEVTGTTTTTYLRGINLISGSGKFYLYNAHGDVVQLTDATGAVTKTYSYDAFGNEHNPDETDANPFRYCGEYYDTETGLYYLRARYYDPLIGRFTQEDTHWNTANMIYGDNPQKINEREDALGLKAYSYTPQLLSIIQAGNLYIYCVSNPIMLCDPSGKLACQMAPDGSSSQLRQLDPIMVFSAGLFIAGTAIVKVCQNISPPIIWAKGKKATFTKKETPAPESASVAASPASPLPPDDDDQDRNWEKVKERYLERKLSEQGTDPHSVKKEYLGEKAKIKEYDLLADKNSGQLGIFKKKPFKMVEITHYYIK